MMPKRQHTIPEAKKKIVEELLELIKKNNTVLVCSIKNIPASQFQQIKKNLRGKAVVKVPKKSLIYLAIEKSKNTELQKIKDKIQDSVAVLFSNIDSFELASELLKNKTPASAKPGQEAPEDIVVSEGPTDLPPGPAVSDFGALGIQIKIEKGKINIQKSKVIAKKGEKISELAADIMSKLGIKPFKIGFIPLAAFDKKDNKTYLEIEIDSQTTLEKLKQAYSKALPFAVEIGYVCGETIGFLLAKASLHAKHLEQIIDKSSKTLPQSEEGSSKKSDKESDENKGKKPSDSLEKTSEEKSNEKTKNIKDDSEDNNKEPEKQKQKTENSKNKVALENKSAAEDKNE